MAERSTARPADGAAQLNDPASDIDSWISQLSRPAASDSDTNSEWQAAAAPQWRDDVSDPYEELYTPAETNQEHDGRHARHRAHQYEDESEQFDGAYGQCERAYRQPDPIAYPEPERDEPDHTYQYDEHELADREQRRAPEPYVDAGPVHEDAYAALQETYVLPEVGYTHEEHHPQDDDPGRNGYRHEEPDAQDLEAVEDGRPRVQHRKLDARPRPASRRRRLITVGGLALGMLLGALAFMWGSSPPPEGGLPLSTATIPPDASEEPITLPVMPSTAPTSATPSSSSATPRTTRSVTRSATHSATPSTTGSAAPPSRRAVTTPTPTPTQSSGPLLLGPSSNDGVATMAQQYCDQHAAGSSAQPRNDGRWQCTKLLFASVVEMDVACRDTYGAGAYAQTSNPGDPYAWRCYR
ncbi:hypothetical protein [Micromonospora sp. NPDC047740]|uniref:hypothetical protein n=1 Tax=Micromonospora sp. NPDC047740 TaxID=3364254 RepID=UPI003711097F